MVTKTNLLKLSLLVTLIALVLSLQPATAVVEAAPQQQTNLLTNAGFEGSYSGIGEANGWGRWFRAGSKAECEAGYHVEPRWGKATDFVYEGSSSQYVGNNWDTFAAGVYQTVTVTPGTTYRFSFWSRVHGGNEAAPAPSDFGLNTQTRAGVDLSGSGNWTNASVQGAAGSPHDTWQQFSVEFTATGDKATVFAMTDWGISGTNQCRQFMSNYFDAAELVEVGPPPTNTPVPQPTSPPPPPATNTPVPPTNTPTPEIPPTNTPEPTPTASPTPTGGTICVNAFADANGNGINDADEGYMAGVTFIIASGDQVVGQAVSTGMPDPICFDNLPPGEYQVAQDVPSRLEMTTAGTATIVVEEGKTFGIEFGSRVRSDDPVATEIAQVQATATSGAGGSATPEEDGGGNALAYVGLGVIGLAIIGLIGLVVFVLRKS